MINNTMCTITHTTTADPLAWYSVPFEYVTELNVPQIAVKYDDTDLTYGSDYTVGVSGLQLLIESEAGKTLVITRTSPFTQETDYQTGLIVPEEIENSFDLCAMRDQELQARMDIISELPEELEERLTVVEEMIPEEASEENQLADKSYVDTLVGNHTADTNNPHSVTAAQVGLGNCDNTSDLDKPVSTATQSALNLKANSADLSTVATSGAYSDLSGTPTLGTAAAAATTDFATAAQGTLADTAVQPGDLATVATSGAYSDLSGTPTLGTMAAESATDYTKTASLATVATTGAYSDLSGTPTIPASIDDLSDVTITTPASGEFLMYDGSKWANTTSSASVGFSAITGDPYDNTNLATALNSKAPSGAVDTLLAALYPVGSIYIGTQSTCPLASLIPGSSWTQIEGRYLLASGTLNGTSENYSAGNTVAAGLPNITGELFEGYMGLIRNTGVANGCFSKTTSRTTWLRGEAGTGYDVGFAASNSSSVFGQSSTVRAPAYVINVWRRTA